MASLELTPEQRRGRGGSGRQPAGVRRRRLRQDQGAGGAAVRLYGARSAADVDDFLIITYTKAAAAELRGRIAAELTPGVAGAAGERATCAARCCGCIRRTSRRWTPSARRLLRENIHLLPPEGQRSLTPDFRVLDRAGGGAAAACGCWSGRWRSFTQRIGREDAQARQLAETLGAGRDDRALERLVLEHPREDPEPPLPHAVAGAGCAEQLAAGCRRPWGLYAVARC